MVLSGGIFPDTDAVVAMDRVWEVGRGSEVTCVVGSVVSERGSGRGLGEGRVVCVSREGEEGGASSVVASLLPATDTSRHETTPLALSYLLSVWLPRWASPVSRHPSQQKASASELCSSELLPFDAHHNLRASQCAVWGPFSRVFGGSLPRVGRESCLGRCTTICSVLFVSVNSAGHLVTVRAAFACLPQCLRVCCVCVCVCVCRCLKRS